MDPRGLGSFDRQKISVVENAVWAMDDSEAGKEGRVRSPHFSLAFRAITESSLHLTLKGW